jgi:hypothetical protein
MAGKNRPAGTESPYEVTVKKKYTAINATVSVKLSCTELLNKTLICPPCELNKRVAIGLY